MKKTIILAAIAMLAFAGNAAAETASAGQTIYGCGTASCTAGSSNTLIGKLSTGVTAGWTTSSTGYAIATFHTSGSQMYGTAHDSTSLYRKEASALAAPSVTGSGAFPSGESWSAL